MARTFRDASKMRLCRKSFTRIENRDSRAKDPELRDLFEGLLESDKPKWKKLLQDEKIYSLSNDLNHEAPMEGESVPDFSLNKFARLCILLRDDDLSRAAMHNGVGLELTRLQLEDGVTRDSFRGTVEKRFNDTSVENEGRLDGSLQKKKRSSADSASMIKECLAQVSKTPACITEAFNKKNPTDDAHERDARIHKKLELLRAELRNRRLDTTFKQDDEGAKAELFVKKWSVKHINNLMKSFDDE
ncbi:hypothetical protein FGB62_201g03 [Gracilaria domingensis]|nr:hypothetical protein FGB62_201g03 [Gracilaria domingensis]